MLQMRAAGAFLDRFDLAPQAAQVVLADGQF